ncbi:hypothetical protein [Microvirga sp. 2TAF3]|uniref:hypothetical protein n=1 Tax=Microvirga sp. 2TAF3 TaxID=3233014 RepID=UPI003F9CC0B4
MNKILILSGAAAIALSVMSEGAEAKKIFYEIHGKRYSYESNDPKQVESARKRIDAANVADVAKAKAEAERSSSSLAAVFGSHAQKEAEQAQEQLEQVLAEQDEADAGRKQGRVAKSWQRRKHVEEQARQPDAPDEQDGQITAKEQQPANPAPPPPSTVVSNVESAVPNKAKSMVKTVSFDVASGIKTTIMTDGAIQEEPFDSHMLSKLAFEQDSTGSLTEFVNQLRKVPPEDMTGSTAARADLAANNSSPVRN